jgi:hypothetical protein
MVATSATAGSCDVPARAEARLCPLGLPLTIAADEPFLAVAADLLSGWEGSRARGAPELRLELATTPGPLRPGQIHLRVESRCLHLDGGGVEAWADAHRGIAHCILAADFARNPERLRDEVIEPLVLFLLTHHGRAPLHAAGILAGDLAILLAGPSGSGKSCLALAAARAGMALLSDDTVYVQLEPSLAVWGIPRPVHVFPDDAPAVGAGPPRLRNGKLKRAVPIAQPSSAPAAKRAVLCVLRRGDRARLRPIAAAEALAMLEPIEPGFDLLAAEVCAAQAALAANGAWLLETSANPAEAIALLLDRRDELERTAAP